MCELYSSVEWLGHFLSRAMFENLLSEWKGASEEFTVVCKPHASIYLWSRVTGCTRGPSLRRTLQNIFYTEPSAAE